MLFKDEAKLMNLDLQKENKKIEKNEVLGIKLYFFRLLYVLLQNQKDSFLRDLMFIIIEFIQLIAFPMDKIFTKSWKNYWFGTVGHFLRYFQLIYLWEENGQFYIISYICVCLYILLFLILVIYAVHLLSNFLLRSKGIIGLILTLYEFEACLNIPFCKILLGSLPCTNGVMKYSTNIKCYSGLHLGMIFLGCFLLIIYLIPIILFHMTLFEFGAIHGKLRAAFTSSTEVKLVLMKIILVIIYQFIKHEMALALITLCIGIFLLFDFLEKMPFIKNSINKLYFILYLLFVWTGFTCVIALLLKDSKFEGGILLLLLGYPFAILAIVTREMEFTVGRVFEYVGDKHKDGYKVLMEIEYFLKLEDSLEDNIKERQQKILYSYIDNYETNCTDNECSLKQFLEYPLKLENFQDMKICLLQHAEMLYKNAVSKYPFNAKLRLSYAIFLYKRLNKKQKGTNEILLLNRYTTNLEDAFLIYRAQRYIEEENEGHSDSETNSKIVNSITYKAILNNIKSLIGKITTNYIDFWTILAISDETKSENFLKMSRIGTKISKLNEDLISDIERLERVNLYDQDIIKLYTQYLSEIVNNQTKANAYNDKLLELEQKKHQFNEENLYDLNYKAMARSEEYKFLVISGSPSNFGTICNLSLCLCPLFGFTKEELIGRPLDFLLPELFCIPHRNILTEKVDEFKKTMLVKNKNLSQRIRSEPRIIQSFAKNKMKYLVPVRVKIAFVSTEEGNIFGIGKFIIDNHSTMSIEEETAYILTDKDLIVQNFSSNSPKLLSLNSSAINNNLEITDYIKEFNEQFMHEMNEYSEAKENNNFKMYKKIKINLLKKLFFGDVKKKLITWRLGDVVNNRGGDQSSINFGNQRFMSKFKSNFDLKTQSALSDINVGNLKFSKKYRASHDFKKKSFIGALPQMVKLGGKSELVNSNSIEDKLLEGNNNNVDIFNPKDDNKFSQVYHKFALSVEEVKFGEAKLGYVFKFELFNENHNPLESDITTSKLKANYISRFKNPPLKDASEIPNAEVMSSISFAGPPVKPPEKKQIIFNATPENPNGVNLGLDQTYIPNINRENQFSIDVSKMSYRQLGQLEKISNNSPIHQLYDEAINKLSKLKKMKQAENNDSNAEEEEEDESSYTDSESSGSIDESSANKNPELADENLENKSEDKAKRNSGRKSLKTPQNTEQLAKEAENKEKKGETDLGNVLKHGAKDGIDDFYHVNMSKISFSIFNFTSGYVEVVKDPKYKISEVIKSTNAEKEKLKSMNAKFLAGIKIKERKKGPVTKKVVLDDDEMNAYSEKKIKLREIQKALASKEKQQTIINLCIFSFVVFIFVIGSSVTSILINNYLSNKTLVYYNLIEKSVTLYRNLIFEINFVRELILLANPIYTNIYEKNKELYYNNFAEACYDYYLDTAFVLSNLSTTINTLSQENKEKIVGAKGELEIVDSIRSKDGDYKTKPYQLLIYSAFNELNAALYHVSQMKMREINSYEDNVYYFTRNAMNHMLVLASEQIDNFTNEFYNEIKNGEKVLFICMAVIFVIYAINYYLFITFYEKVEERKQSYLAVFYEIGSGFIVSSLAKCEKFSQKIQIQDDIVGNNAVGGVEKISLDSSSNEDSDNENDIGSIASLKQNTIKKPESAGKARKIKKVSHTLTNLAGFIILFVLLAIQIFSYYFYYLRLELYKHYVQYEYYNNNYNSRFLFPFIALREYLYDPKKILLLEEVDAYLEKSLNDFYIDLAYYSNERDKYTQYLPKSYSDFISSLFRDNQCSFIHEFLELHNDSGIASCDAFFYNTSSYGFQAILTTYIEEIRIMRDLEVSYLETADNYMFSYNESLINTGFDDLHYPCGVKCEQYCEKEDSVGQCIEKLKIINETGKDYIKDLVFKKMKTYVEISEINHIGVNDIMKLYNRTNPALILQEDTHKITVIIYRHVVMKVVQAALDNLFDAIHLAFDTTTNVSLILNGIFTGLVVVGFFTMWLPFVLGENETIYKTKNMLSIIPKEVLITLPHINIMLGIEEN